ncbi:hypothetical protein [Mesorhizobium sp. BH1-1-4]|uniref:hypothetical protein n=1 Tax=Mesorhizobium sp. BH1-1-4 TaxID=2876662 RepID=UPI001CD0D4A1|nr:hypothetical protein [Mesorhizobium sp. BH1-1-4]MBZ9997871.1 hypothetical protein [Mesorhizobium sp. BH1-1-4]
MTLVMAAMLFIGPTGSAKAACVAASGNVENCTGAPNADISYTAPGVTTLNVNTLTIDPSRISLTGTGAAPADPSAGVQHYTCSSNDPARCTITPATPASNGHPATAESCAGPDCVAPPATAAGGPSGNSGPTLTVNYNQPAASTNTSGSGAVIANGTIGVLGSSSGSRGGNGSNGYVFSNGGDGHDGADGGSVTVNVTGAVQTSNNCVLPTACPNAGIVASSVAGDGGDGGDAKGISGNAGDGGLGGSGGTATANFNGGSVETFGNYSAGVVAISQGGHGGNGGGGGGLVFNPGGGSPAGSGGNANVFTGVGTTIVTHGIYSHGIVAQSIGGGGGGSAGGFGLFSSSGGSGGNGGNGGIVQVTNNAAITTWGNNSQGILAQTIGGGGGDGGSNFGLFASGGSGSLGGNGGPANVVTVGVTNSGAIVTHGQESNGILAQSIGGGGGNGGNSGGLVSLGGNGASTTNGGIVEVTNTAAGSIDTDGKQSAGIFAQSVGGGGGNGGTSGGLFSAGGKGGAGGNGARVTVTNAGDIETGKNAIFDSTAAVNSAGIFAQSVGGGGGNGGGAFSGGLGFSVALGGAGGSGGTSGAVEVLRDASDTAYSIITHGDQSDAVFAQSIGGGGGNGGFAVSGAIGPLALAMGGAAGNASDGNTVTVETAGSLTTYGDGSRGIFAQSIGGTGGNGGAAIAVAVNATGTFAAAIGIGGNGGKGGASKLVTVSSLSDISTSGDNAAGLVAQSVGGGGGNGGYSIGGAIGGIGIAVNIGGQGAGGGAGADVIVGSSGSIHTKGENSTGILAQSIGGGGGNGGFTVSAAIGVGAASVGLGGAGADGSNAGNVIVNADGANHAVTMAAYAGTWNLVTEGKNAVGVQAESIGGGGGNGGFSGSLTLGGVAAVGVNLGGKGGGGGDAGTATVNNGKKVGNVVTQNSILTIDDGSTGILAQSIGGGGGNGGFAVTVSGSGSYEGAGGAAAVSIGGSGATGGVGKDVFVTSYGNIATNGKQADGILAQSIGGGGGNGGFSVAGTFTTGAFGASVAIGGSGGTGQLAGAVTVTSTGNIQTHGDQSIGIMAQSVGGGGGNGGFAGSGAITLQGVAAAVGLGGNGAGGGSAKTVKVTSTGNITTYGDQSIGILAQSVGGGGGNGGSTVSLALGLDAGIAVGLGGKGGAAGAGLDVTVISTGNISTGAGFTAGDVRGTGAAGILAQSVGGGGGNGGFAGSLGGGKSIAIGVSLGGNGAGGGAADIVKVTSTGNISTNFDNSSGIIAQSIGGGGGNGGFAVAVSGAIGDPDAATAAVAIGGKGGVGGIGKDVTVTSTGTITTTGKFSNGILAQSIGGGGGNGGFAIAGSATTGNAGIGVGVGGKGATGSTAGKVVVNSYSLVDGNGLPVLQAPPSNTVSIWTQGDNSSGIFAQSVGGGGGSGGFAGSLGVGLGGGGLGVSIGGGAGSGSNADTVTVTSYNNILTQGKDSFGILAQSVGGGGGNGGFAIALSGSNAMAASVAVGGSGSSGGAAEAVTVTSHGSIETDGDGSHAIFAQSVGGGGGNGGGAVAGTLTGRGAGSLAVGVGGSGDNGGDAKSVTVTSTGDLRTEGLKADGILAQSIGGGGGNGGFSGALAITAGQGAVGVGVGGSGAGGGNADTVTVTSTGNIVTLKNGSNGILAQSVGGGGGNGGAAVTIAGSAQQAAAAVSVGGSGAKGGTSKLVTVNNTGTIDTTGDKANGILAQSIGGGGGTGGFAISGEMVVDGAGGAAVSVGGNGGTGQDGGAVIVNSNVGTTLADNNATVHTVGGDSNGIFAQSVGGGGGDGGFSGAISVTGQNAKAAIAVSVGGSGAGSGDGKTVNVTSVDNVLTEGNGANGILAQSVGGGGGNGGFSFAATIKGSLGKNPGKNGAVSVSLGGGAGSGGDAEKVTVDSTGIIQTGGDKAFGVLAQSVGGGGGTGGLSVAAALNLGEGGNQITAAVGGEGGGGGTGGEVLLTRHGSTVTTGDQSVGLFAQSVGGSGGNGGMAISGVIAGTDAKTLSASVGGFGGAGTNSGKVTIDNTGAISTYGIESHAIQAQSIGGGGGNGGMAVSAVIGSLGTGTNFNAGVTVGGFGGDAGFAGDVFVTNHGLLQTGLLAAGQTTTNGDGAYGIFAQSVGGGGGSGGNAITGVLGLNGNNAGTQVNVSVAVGGAAGDGNKGGNVTIRQYGGIETSGVGAFGILAQSIGGGGGTGGRANSISLQLGAKCTLPKVCEPAGGKPNWNLQGVVGGAGGTGNDAETVEVGNYDFITTHGDKSSGIVAQSIGGGGGIGGDAYVGTGGLFAIPYVPVDPTLLLKPLGTSSLTRSGTVAIGGNGAGGGNGGTVIVANESVITTFGTKSDGIHAQSIGGGGGDGGDGQAGALGTVGIGGQGKAAGNGGSVTVTNGKTDLSQAGTAIIETHGTSPTPPAEGAPSADPEQGYSAGIFAQSVGGGGGTGGGAGGLLSLGGSGKAGGIGGHVTVNNYGGILTHADDSVGVFAQSIGGGGGAGGSLGISAIAVGGSGGSSGNGGQVDVINDAMIETHGIDSYAIQAQSVGGGGGSGGGKNGGITGSIPALIAIGGAGGSSGIGGIVTVTNNNSLHTYGAGADGINAQSIGGGGGSGGRAIGFIAVGGKGGDVGNGTMAGSNGGGGAVTVNNNANGTITVEGIGAHGIFAQSVGAGGGSGGGGIGASIVPTSVGVGGDGGSSGDGGVVTVNNHGDITTVSASSVAIFAESIGGGGGNGAMSIAAALSPGALTFGIGGDGGASGKGGDVNVTNFSDGFIHTQGFGSTGIMAQSVGGGGGNGGATYSVAGGVPGFSLALGGKGSAGGDGGVVTVVNNGQMQLDGDNSVAIFAQSVGGGGGSGGTAIAATIGPPVFIGGDSGATGKGGDVTVTNTGVIVLKGNGSVGIFAQSVGGGGGVMTAGTDGIIEAVNGGSGDGGKVTINSNVAMLITGDNSVGVFGQSVGGGGGVGGFSGNFLGLDQAPAATSLMVSPFSTPAPQGFMGSAGGAGVGGDVTFEQTANLYVTGKNSSALMEQSSGGGSDIADNGDINVTIAKDVMIIGGSGTGAGVSYLDGRDNVLTNNGFVGAVTGADGCIPGVDAGCERKIDGYAMLGGVGNDTYNNFKDTMGSIALGGGQNAFNNEKDAIYRMGDTVDLGGTGQFSNDGYVAPGDLDHVLTTYVTGNWTQSGIGTYLLDLDLDPQADQINITGTADLDGKVNLNIMEPGAAKPGTEEYLILHADGGITDSGLVLDSIPSAVALYKLVYEGLDDLYLNVDINFARTGLTENQTSVGRAVNAIQTDLTSPAFEKIAAALFYIPTLDQLGAVYDSISGEGVSGFEQPQFDAYDTFMASMNRQANFWRTGLGTDPTDYSLKPQAYDEPAAKKKDPFKAMQPDERRWSYWATAGGNAGDLGGDAVVGSAENVYRGGSFAAGLESTGDSDMVMGFALGGAAASFAVDDRQTSGNIIGAQAGAYVARKWDQFYINGGLAFGLYNNNVHRATSVPGSDTPLDPVPAITTENWRSNFLSAGFGTNVEAGWRQQVGQGAITPFAALQFSFLSMDAFDETSLGGGALGLSFNQRVITSLPVSLGLQLDTTIAAGGDRSLQAWGRAAWVHEFEPDRSVKPSFQAAPGYSFVIQGAAAAEDAVAVNAGLKMNWNSNTSMFATFDGKFGDGVQTYGGNVGFKVNW